MLARLKTRSFAHILAVYAIALQVVMPAAMAQGDDNNILRYLCVSSGAVPDKAAVAIMRDLAPFLEDGGTGVPTGSAEHCPLCVFADSVPLPDKLASAVVPEVAVNTGKIRHSTGPMEQVELLPVGSRAPPVSL